ncbi:hypothetical protein [Nocardia vaccinii]|uniref:hypothetical protein n=1 Tax=Nocardia vaccinii TaxID=1822 RepID=UPI000ABE8CFD|nr:hypothetical protein [Nocardia vaccinii]
MPQFSALDVLAGFLVREHLLAPGRGERVELAAEQLARGRDPGVADEGTASADRVEGVTVKDERRRRGGDVGHGRDCTRKVRQDLLHSKTFRHVFPTAVRSGRPGILHRPASHALRCESRAMWKVEPPQVTVHLAEQVGVDTDGLTEPPVTHLLAQSRRSGRRSLAQPSSAPPDRPKQPRDMGKSHRYQDIHRTSQTHEQQQTTTSNTHQQPRTGLLRGEVTLSPERAAAPISFANSKLLDRSDFKRGPVSQRAS